MNYSCGFLSRLEITVPTAIVDENKVRKNIKEMADKALATGVRLRPHMKTHQSAEMAGWFREHGVTGITVSSLTMAEYFVENGWDDVTVAFPVNILEIETINRLAEKIKLGLLVDSREAAQFLEENLASPVNIWIKIDVGYGRAGILWNDSASVVELAKVLLKSKIMTFTGLLTHAGHSYDTFTRKDLKLVHDSQIKFMEMLKSDLARSGIPACRISIGDTPTCKTAKDFPCVDEIRPGSFIFNDLDQCNIGSCGAGDIALAIACPVVSVFSRGRRKLVIIYGGSVHFSKDYFYKYKKEKLFGYLVTPTDNGWSRPNTEAYLFSLSQEHGKLYVPDEMIGSISVGDVLLFLPVHCCLTARMYDHYITTEGRKITRLY